MKMDPADKTCIAFGISVKVRLSEVVFPAPTGVTDPG
jgi:hypothetical protein